MDEATEPIPDSRMVMDRLNGVHDTSGRRWHHGDTQHLRDMERVEEQMAQLKEELLLQVQESKSQEKACARLRKDAVCWASGLSSSYPSNLLCT